MIHSDRIRGLLEARDISQSELARRVGVTQGAIAKIAKNNPNGSSHLHVIARELLTTPAYLTGETDDPDANAPAPPAAPRHQFVTLQVVLPSEDALARMFEGLLRTVDRAAAPDVLARTLAKRLPIGLSQLRDLLLPDVMDDAPAPDADRPLHDEAHHASPRSSRT